MKIVIDQDAVRRRATIAHVASLGGQLILLGGVAISLWKPAWSTLTTAMIIGGFAIAAVGIYQANRWVKKPRPEAVLNEALKGLSDQYGIYHYLLPCEHVLLTPGGVVVLETCSLEGVFSYRRGRWRQKMSMGRAVRFLVEERLGDPIERAQACAKLLAAQIKHRLEGRFDIPVWAMVVFTSPAAELMMEEETPIPVCQPKKLRNRLPKNMPRLPDEAYRQLVAVLDEMAGLKPMQIEP